MTKLYSTEDYFRDSFWFVNWILDNFLMIKRSLNHFLKKLINRDIETYVFRIIENLPYGIAIIFLGFFAIVAIVRITEPKNGIIVSSIYTNSMNPSIKPGSLVVTIPNKSYVIGDIITYKEKEIKNARYTGRVLTHRITEIKIAEDNNISFIAQGDNNKNPDVNSIESKDILGIVKLVFPYFGYVDFLASTIPGFLILICIPSYFVIYEATKYMRS